MSVDPGEDWVEITTIGDLLLRAGRRWPDKEALIFPDERRTYAELLHSCERAARSLLGLGVGPGDRVGVLMPNCFEFVELQLGCAMLGVSVVPINARYKTYELAHVLDDSDMVAIATTDLIVEHVDLAAIVAEAATERPPRLRHLLLLGGSAREGFLDAAEFAAAADGVAPADVASLRDGVRLRDEAMMMYTSGTTSKPKGCIQTHEALVRTGIEAARRWRLTHDERFWNPLPMFHMGGVFPLLAHMWAGATVMTQTHFDPVGALEMMQAERCTFAYPTFPTITQSLIRHPRFAGTDLSTVRLVNDTGAADSLRLVQEHFPQAPVVTLFGMTETCGGVSWSAPEDPYELRMTTGGLPFRGTRVRIVDPDTDEELPPGERGEITVRGPGLFERYHKDPAKTAEAMRGGWFHTGDLGTVGEDGRLTYLGRLKDMLKVGGENVAAVEVEAYLGTHPAVKVAQVVGVPDAKYGEVPAAFVELADGASATEADIVEFCQGRIASFKVPRHVRFVDEWPMSASKIQKFRLRDRILAELEVGASAS
jgi:fatty-acyl-CoA synthase